MMSSCAHLHLCSMPNCLYCYDTVSVLGGGNALESLVVKTGGRMFWEGHVSKKEQSPLPLTVESE